LFTTLPRRKYPNTAMTLIVVAGTGINLGHGFTGQEDR